MSYMLWCVSIILIDGNLFDDIFLQFLTFNGYHVRIFMGLDFFLSNHRVRLNGLVF